MTSIDLQTWWVDTVQVETYQGETPNGPQWAAAVSVPCFVDETLRLVRTRDGDEVASGSTVFADASWLATFPEQSRVTYDGRTSTVITCETLTTEGLAFGLDHIQAHLL